MKGLKRLLFNLKTSISQSLPSLILQKEPESSGCPIWLRPPCAFIWNTAPRGTDYSFVPSSLIRTGSEYFSTTSSVTMHFLTSFIPGISYMTCCMIFSMMARSPLAPVFLSMAWRAMAWMAPSSNSSST